MKTVAKLVIILVVGVLLSLIIYPVGRTTWADGVRERVQKIRAERRAAQMASQKADGKTADRPAVKEQKLDKPGEAGPRKGPTPKPPTCSVAAFVQGGKSLVQILVPCLLTAIILLIKRRVTTA